MTFKRYTAILLLPFFILQPLFAQESIGHSEPDNIQPLLDYRLPAWGFSNFTWDLSLNGDLQNRITEDESWSQDRITGNLRPNYTRYRESESRVSSYDLISYLNYSLNDREFPSGTEEYRKSWQTNMNWNFSEILYFEDTDLFLNGVFLGGFNQNRTHFKEASPAGTDMDEARLSRSINPSISIGVGYGRLRNVNPMIRSLRLNERLNALDTEQTMNQQDFFEAAEHFTKFGGYQQVYDRPQKHFWGDMDQTISTDLSALAPFDLLSLTETTFENIGSRMEGWRISAHAGLRHQLSYTRDEDNISGETDSNISRSTYFIPEIRGIWSKNISLEHQLRLDGDLQYHRGLGNDNMFNIRLLNTSASWLYTLTDRILTNTFTRYSRNSREEFAVSRITVGTEVNYFLENRLSLFSNLAYNYTTNSGVSMVNGTITSTQDLKRVTFSAGIRFHMWRGLY